MVEINRYIYEIIFKKFCLQINKLVNLLVFLYDCNRPALKCISSLPKIRLSLLSLMKTFNPLTTGGWEYGVIYPQFGVYPLLKNLQTTPTNSLFERYFAKKIVLPPLNLSFDGGI